MLKQIDVIIAYITFYHSVKGMDIHLYIAINPDIFTLSKQTKMRMHDIDKLSITINHVLMINLKKYKRY